MTAGKPDNLVRKTLRRIGIGMYRLGLASTVIKMNSSRVRAMLYHAVEPQSDSFTNGLNVSVTPAMFAANLDYFKKHYNVVPMSAVAENDLPERALVITFDDGYLSVYKHAMPALHERSMSACIYLITRAVEGKIVWVNLINHALHQYPEQTSTVLKEFEELASLNTHGDILATVQHKFPPVKIEALCTALTNALPAIQAKELYANEADIKDMQAHGLEFGFHTRDHYNLRNCDAGELEEQLDSSGCLPLMNSNTFAYPFGYFDKDAVAQVESCQYNRIMTVGNNNQAYSEKHLDRMEVFTDNPAEIFAQIEVVEPIIAKLRKWMLKPGDGTLEAETEHLNEEVDATKNPAK